jgi:3-deoxy-7-phosphoheptulonate synthase
MVVVMNENATEEQIQTVISKLIESKFDVHRSTGVNQTVLGALGDKRGVDTRNFELMDGVHEVLRITTPYKLASRTFHPEDTVIKIREVTIGGNNVVVMAGPCSVETPEQIEIIAAAVRKNLAPRHTPFKVSANPDFACCG